MNASLSKISLFFLLVVAIIGTLLRTPHLIPISFEYSNLVHAHSHVAFQGWIYTLMLLLLIKTYVSKHQIEQGHYLSQFKLTVIVILGVLVSFSLQGYALYSIIFSTLFQLLNYWFIYRFFKDVKETVKTVSLSFIKTGLWLGILSTLIPIGIGVLAAKGQNNTEAYEALVYTFLHLQYNGWFLFVALGLFYKFLERRHIAYSSMHAKRFYQCLTIAVIPAIALSLLGMSFSKIIIPVAAIASILQGLGLLFFLFSIKSSIRHFWKQKNSWLYVFLLAFVICFTLKIVLQSLSIVPAFKHLAFQNKPIILAYLHLSLIGVISILFIAFLIDLKWLLITKLSIVGNTLLLSGFLTTEFLLVYGGLGYAYPISLLSIGSAIMTIGILCLLISKTSKKA